MNIRACDRIFLTQGWWEGKLNGKTGVFPNNFVEELPAGSAPPEPEPEEDAVIPPAPLRSASSVAHLCTCRGHTVD